MAQRDERTQQRRSTYRTYRTYRTVRSVRKRRMLTRLVVPGGGFLTVFLVLPILMVVIIGTALGGAEAERLAACGQQAPAPAPEEYDGSTLPGTEDYAPSFMFDARNIAQVAANAGFVGEDLVIAVAVARAESGGQVAATHTNTNGSIDYGLWQINSVHVASGFDPARSRDPAYNAMWAYRIFEAAGKQWSPWTTYNTGAYREFLPVAKAAAEQIGTGEDLPWDGGGGLTGIEDCPSDLAMAPVSVQGSQDPQRSRSIGARAWPAITFARQQLGDPYEWGAIGPDTWDCSSLVQAAWATAGVRLPRVSRDQFAAVTQVPGFDIHPGDLIFYGDPVHHVVMYTGDGRIIEAPSAGLTVRERDVYWTDVRGVGRPAAS